MSVVKLKGRKLPYYAVVSTGKKIPGTKRYGQLWSKHGYASRGEAKDEEARLREGLRNKTLVKPSEMTVDQMLDGYIRSKKDIVANTVITYESFRKRICSQPLGQKKVQDVTKMDVEAFRVWIYDQGLSQSLIRQTLSFICSAFNWACDLDIVFKSPARRLKLPSKPEAKGLHIEERLMVRILLLVKKYQYERIYIPLLLAGNAGLRISEICGLTRDCVKNGVLIVKKQYLRKGKGVKDFSDPKSRKSVRLIPVSPFVMNELRAYEEFIDRAKKRALVRRFELLRSWSFDAVHSEPAWHDSSLLYVRPENGKPYVRDAPEKQWRVFKKKNSAMLKLIAKHPELASMRIHDFRHTFGSNLRFAGAAIEDVSELMGHSDVAFTARTYALPLKQSHKRAMEKYSRQNAPILERLEKVPGSSQ